MNSIDDAEISSSIRSSYFDEMMPVAEKLRRQGVSFFPLKAAREAQSYYQRRKKTAMTREDFEPLAGPMPEAIGEELVRFWQKPELAKLATSHQNLANALRSHEEQSDEVSPFVYVMF